MTANLEHRRPNPARRLKLIGKATFAPTGQPATGTINTFTIKR